MFCAGVPVCDWQVDVVGEVAVRARGLNTTITMKTNAVIAAIHVQPDVEVSRIIHANSEGQGQGCKSGEQHFAVVEIV
jgi:hypothetical protein